ncbi:SCO family protein [Amycolatopsis solani]|uniref:SCO family protein n=1 Tax=Amycolatopsis solani TaxID=3028615 RepID=UPI0025B0080E|nr:SCO family protein [Amycolatopsis sp. MEP2-6]
MSVTHHPVRPRYTLVDHHGREVTEQDFPGRHQLVFFGFTHCRAVCPRVLGLLSTVLDDLGPLADRIQPLYISVDPERDTPDVLRAFLERTYPRFLGLTGSPEAAEAARAAFRIFAGRGADPEDPEGYAVPHTALTYLLDPGAAYLAHFPDVLAAAEIADRIRKLVR